jgi:carbohydrate-selective porin OprB
MRVFASEMTRLTRVFFSAVAAATSLTSFAAEAPKSAPAVIEERSFWQRDTLTGDWFGARTALEKRGIKFDLFFTEYYTGLFAGGATDQSFEFGGRADALIRIDTDKLGLWEGGGFQVHLESRFGKPRAALHRVLAGFGRRIPGWSSRLANLSAWWGPRFSSGRRLEVPQS